MTKLLRFEFNQIGSLLNDIDAYRVNFCPEGSVEVLVQHKVRVVDHAHLLLVVSLTLLLVLSPAVHLQISHLSRGPVKLKRKQRQAEVVVLHDQNQIEVFVNSRFRGYQFFILEFIVAEGKRAEIRIEPTASLEWKITVQ